MKQGLRNQLQHWYISYDPYSDIFQMYDSKALELRQSLM